MAGIYIHIPFCRQACHYCDFYFSTSLKNKKDFLLALKEEIYLQKDYIRTKNISTVYFGGGTPSVLSKGEILEIFNELSKYFLIDLDAEITLESNPDDLSKEKLKELSQTPVNRLSIGIQSFSDVDLKFLNRVHSSTDAMESVRNAQEAGFDNLTIDLIYGIQTLTNEQWKQNLEKAFALDVQHVSCYSLTVEPKTAIHSFISQGKIPDIDAQKSAVQFEMLMEEMKKHQFIHYEISNFCREGFYSKHNSNYWKGEKYLGLGPSAHSYDTASRQWNISSNSVYIDSLKKNIVPFEKEILTEEKRYNEYILTSLRTMWGVDISLVKSTFSHKIVSHFEKELRPFMNGGMISNNNNKIILANKGKLFADRIASDLFIVT